MADLTTDESVASVASAGALGVNALGGTSATGGTEREFTIKARTQRQLILRRFLQHRAAVISAVVLVLVALVAFVLDPLWSYSYKDLTNDISTAPNLSHPMGTDSEGHDLLSQVLRGTQRSLEIALTVAIASTLVGSVVGAVAGYYRGFADTVLMRFVDVVLTIPSLAIAAVLGANLAGGGSSSFAIAGILAALGWASPARVVRGQVLSLREKEYVEAARALGATDRRIIFRHLLPNALGPIIVNVTILVAYAILAESALSFVGFGVQAPDTSLGLLIAQNQTAFDTRPWLFWFPGIVIILIALTVNFIGDGLRDAFDPTQTRVRA